MVESLILTERRDGGLWLTLNRPERRNALTLDMIATIAAALSDADDATFVVFRSEGRDFCAGGDLSALADMQALNAKERAELIADLHARSSQPLLQALSEVRAPIIASARGNAIGVGALLILAADLAVASETLRFSIPQTRLGHCADHGESWYLPRKIGLGRAMEVLLLGEAVDGAHAQRLGIVNWLAADNDLERRCAEITAKLASGAHIAQNESKQLLIASHGADLAEQAQLELAAVKRCAATHDFVEALDASAHKRTPRFRGA